jgi:hypothetical protein
MASEQNQLLLTEIWLIPGAVSLLDEVESTGLNLRHDRRISSKQWLYQRRTMLCLKYELVLTASSDIRSRDMVMVSRPKTVVSVSSVEVSVLASVT